jgi:hypothetical protein
MKTKYLLFAFLIASLGQSCLKPAEITYHSAKVLAATCALGAPSLTEVAVQLDNNDPLSFTWTNPTNDSVYQNVVITFNPVLRQAIGKSFSYSFIRKPNSTDTTAFITPAICESYPIVIFDRTTIK